MVSLLIVRGIGNKQNQLDDYQPAWGQPSCKDWWIASDIGLRDRTIAVLPKKWHQRYWNTLTPKDEDDILKKLTQELPIGYEPANEAISGWYPTVMTKMGVDFSELSVYPKLYAILQAAPLVRALLLLLIYTFLPLALLLGGYRIRAVVTASFFIFGLIFWDYLWLLVGWLDDVLIEALYPNTYLRKWYSQSTIADWIIISLIVVAPLFWFTFMGALGIAAGNFSIAMLSSMTGDSSSAAERGGGFVQSAAVMAVTKAFKSGGKK